jgi:aminoglycoside 6'-N-acetyltransferase I
MDHKNDPPCTVRLAVPADLPLVIRLCADLWPDEPLAELQPHIAAILDGKPWSTLPLVLFVAEIGAAVVGFVEVGLRSHAEGCDGRRAVGFIEGWYVRAAHRRCGVGGALIARAEHWSRDQGAVELASDTWIDHQLSIDAHTALGFEVAERAIHFRKALS